MLRIYCPNNTMLTYLFIIMGNIFNSNTCSTEQSKTCNDHNYNIFIKPPPEESKSVVPKHYCFRESGKK